SLFKLSGFNNRYNTSLTSDASCPQVAIVSFNRIFVPLMALRVISLWFFVSAFFPVMVTFPLPALTLNYHSSSPKSRETILDLRCLLISLPLRYAIYPYIDSFTCSASLDTVAQTGLALVL
ncbi:MAG: hypothetical protein KAR43_03890, partial [Deltaproteobacteria bacterium]|nr:hypothetical protein [Deltaproteobacteria bacterium]